MSSAGLFVSIACFSDPDLLATIYDALLKASHPERISFGICLQVNDNDRQYDVLDQYDLVIVDRMPVCDAKGPIYARARCEALLADEEYFCKLIVIQDFSRLGMMC